jgi:hypothetical protein
MQYYIYTIGTWSHALKSIFVDILRCSSCMLARCCRASTRLATMSQPRTGSSRHLTVDRPNNSPQPSMSSKLEDSSDGLEGAGRAAGNSTIDLVTYDWRTFTANAQLHYTVTEETANECIARITSRASPVTIGLDFEWRPTFTPRLPENPIALVQLACDDEILLVHVSAMQGTVYILLLHASPLRGSARWLITFMI